MARLINFATSNNCGFLKSVWKSAISILLVSLPCSLCQTDSTTGSFLSDVTVNITTILPTVEQNSTTSSLPITQDVTTRGSNQTTSSVNYTTVSVTSNITNAETTLASITTESITSATTSYTVTNGAGNVTSETTTEITTQNVTTKVLVTQDMNINATTVSEVVSVTSTIPNTTDSIKTSSFVPNTTVLPVNVTESAITNQTAEFVNSFTTETSTTSVSNVTMEAVSGVNTTLSNFSSTQLPVLNSTTEITSGVTSSIIINSTEGITVPDTTITRVTPNITDIFTNVTLPATTTVTPMVTNMTVASTTATLPKENLTESTTSLSSMQTTMTSAMINSTGNLTTLNQEMTTVSPVENQTMSNNFTSTTTGSSTSENVTATIPVTLNGSSESSTSVGFVTSTVIGLNVTSDATFTVTATTLTNANVTTSNLTTNVPMSTPVFVNTTSSPAITTTSTAQETTPSQNVTVTTISIFNNNTSITPNATTMVANVTTFGATTIMTRNVTTSSPSVIENTTGTMTTEGVNSTAGSTIATETTTVIVDNTSPVQSVTSPNVVDNSTVEQTTSTTIVTTQSPQNVTEVSVTISPSTTTAENQNTTTSLPLTQSSLLPVTNVTSLPVGTTGISNKTNVSTTIFPENTTSSAVTNGSTSLPMVTTVAFNMTDVSTTVLSESMTTSSFVTNETTSLTVTTPTSIITAADITNRSITTTPVTVENITSTALPAVTSESVPTTNATISNGTVSTVPPEVNVSTTTVFTNVTTSTAFSTENGTASNETTTVSNGTELQTTTSSLTSTIEPVTMTTTLGATTPKYNTSSALEEYWVTTVLRVPLTDDVSTPAFKTKMEGVLAEAYYDAFVRAEQILNGTYQAGNRKRTVTINDCFFQKYLLKKSKILKEKSARLHRHKRDVTYKDVTVQMVEIRRLNKESSVSTNLTYYVVKNGNIVAADTATSRLNQFDSQELALKTGYYVETGAGAWSPAPPAPGPPYWIIGVVLGSVLFLAIVLWLVLIIYYRMCRHRPEKTPRVADIEVNGEPELIGIRQKGTLQRQGLDVVRSDTGEKKYVMQKYQDNGYRQTEDDMKQNAQYYEDELESDRSIAPRHSRRRYDYESEGTRGSTIEDEVEGSREQLLESKKQKANRKHGTGKRGRDPASVHRSANRFEPMTYDEPPPVKIQTSVLQESLPPLQRQPLVGQSPRNPEQEALNASLKQKAEIERWRNKQRARSMKKCHKGNSNRKSRKKAQREIDAVLGVPDSDTSIPSIFVYSDSDAEKKKKSRHKGGGDAGPDREYIEKLVKEARTPKQMSGHVSEAFTTDTDGETTESLQNAREHMHKLLDDAFSLVSPANRNKVGPSHPRLTHVIPKPGTGSNTPARHKRRMKSAQNTPATSDWSEPESVQEEKLFETKNPLLRWNPEEYKRSKDTGPKHTPVQVSSMKKKDQYEGIMWSPYTAEDEVAKLSPTKEPGWVPGGIQTSPQQSLKTTLNGSPPGTQLYSQEPPAPIVLRTGYRFGDPPPGDKYSSVVMSTSMLGGSAGDRPRAATPPYVRSVSPPVKDSSTPSRTFVATRTNLGSLPMTHLSSKGTVPVHQSRNLFSNRMAASFNQTETPSQYPHTHLGVSSLSAVNTGTETGFLPRDFSAFSTPVAHQPKTHPKSLHDDLTPIEHSRDTSNQSKLTSQPGKSLYQRTNKEEPQDELDIVKDTLKAGKSSDPLIKSIRTELLKLSQKSTPVTEFRPSP